MNRTDVAHLFRWVYPSQSIHQKNKKLVSVGRFWVYSEIRGGCFGNFGKIGLKWVAVARIGLKLGGNEATRFRIIFKPDFYIKKCLVGVTLG